MDSLTRLSPFLRGCLCCQSRHVPPDGPPGPTSSHPTGANRVSNVRSNATLVTGVESGGRSSRLRVAWLRAILDRRAASRDRTRLGGVIVRIAARTGISFRNWNSSLNARDIQEKRDLDFPHSKFFARAKIKSTRNEQTSLSWQ